MTDTLQEMLGQVTDLIAGYVPNLVGALGILVLGWLAALLVSSLVKGALHRTTIDNQLANWVSAGRPVAVERHAGTLVFWIVMLFVVVAAFEALNLTVVTEPLNTLLSQLAEFVPRLGGGALLLGLAWIVARLLRRLVSAGLHAIRIDTRIAGEGDETGTETPIADSLSDAVYWLVFLLFLPAILGALALEGLLQPVQSLVDDLLGFLPSLLGAGLILVVGWFIANLVRRIVTNLLRALGADGLAGRVGAGQVIGTMTLSGLVGSIVYVLILIPVLISALNALALDAVTAPASDMLGAILSTIPLLFGAVILLGIAYVVGRIVSSLITNVLAGAGFDALLATLGIAATPAEGRRPSDLVGTLIMVALMLFATIEAAGMLGFEVLGDLIARFLVLGGQVVLGLVIFGIGLFLANLADGAVRASGTRQSTLLALAARVSIIVLAGAMALRQMGLANEIINLAFGLVLGAVAVAAALAFGLGARDVAGRAVADWTEGMRKD